MNAADLATILDDDLVGIRERFKERFNQARAAERRDAFWREVDARREIDEAWRAMQREGN